VKPGPPRAPRPDAGSPEAGGPAGEPSRDGLPAEGSPRGGAGARELATQSTAAQRIAAEREPAEASPVRAASAAEEIEALRAELERRLPGSEPAPRWNADPDDVERSVIQLVLTLVEFIRQLLERQALRRMDEETLTDEQVEAVGRALMRLEETIHDLAGRFGIPPEKLNLDLGPLGRLL
jgi:hypothetical protein